MKRLSVLAVWFALALSANASTISFSVLPPLADTGFISVNYLGLFDPMLGTLTGAELTWSIGTEFSVLGINDSNRSDVASYNLGTSVHLSSSLSAVNSFLPISSLTSLFSTGDLFYSPGETRTFGPIGGAQGNHYDLSSILNSLVGSGSFGVSCDAVSGASGSDANRGGVIFSGSAQAQCGSSIVYTYDAVPATSVPEPGSLALVGLAFACMRLSARRRKS